MSGSSLAAVADPEWERQLAREAAAGDPAAFTALFEAHRGEVYKIARAVTGDGELAKDAVQETFLKVYEGLPRWRGASSLRTWIYRIAVRAAIDQRRRSARHTRGRDDAASTRTLSATRWIEDHRKETLTASNGEIVLFTTDDGVQAVLTRWRRVTP